MKIHHWLLALMVFYVVIAALPDARMIWSFSSHDALEAELVPELRSPPASYELLLLRDLAALSVADEVTDKSAEPVQLSGEG